MSGEVDAFTYSAMRGMTTKEIHELNVKRMSEAAQRQINGGLMNSGMAGALGNAAQGSILASNTTISNTPLVAKTSLGPERTYPVQLQMGVQITQADNGFIVMIGHEYGGMGKHFIAATLEDVTNIITAQLASKMLDRVA